MIKRYCDICEGTANAHPQDLTVAGDVKSPSGVVTVVRLSLGRSIGDLPWNAGDICANCLSAALRDAARVIESGEGY